MISPLNKSTTDGSIELHFIAGRDLDEAYVPNNLSQPEYERIERLIETYNINALQDFYRCAGATDIETFRKKALSRQQETEVYNRAYPTWQRLRFDLGQALAEMGWQYIDSEMQVYDTRFREVNLGKNEWNIIRVVRRFKR